MFELIDLNWLRDWLIDWLQLESKPSLELVEDGGPGVEDRRPGGSVASSGRGTAHSGDLNHAPSTSSYPAFVPSVSSRKVQTGEKLF